MKTRFFLLFSAFVASVLIAVPVSAGTLDQAKVALHLQPYSAKNICLPVSQGGEAPDLTPCSQYVLAGQTGTGYSAYLIVSAYSSAHEHPGVAGLSCGIEYDPDPGSGVDVLNWVTCADLEFTNAGAYGEWPASGGGNRLTYDYTQNCQLTTVPGYESEGVVAVFGAFYVYAYDTDVFSITPNTNLQSGPELVVGDCSGAETALPFGAAGSLAFSPDGSAAGCNPCLQDCEHAIDCSVPAMIDFGTVPLGDSKDVSFTLRNLSNGILQGTVAAVCSPFTVVEGAGAYNLQPDDTLLVTVRYAASSPGYKSCDLYVGGGCPTVQLSASTPSPCSVIPTSLHLGTMVVGDTASGQFSVMNNKTSDLVFELSYNCPDYTVLEGTGPFTLGPGQNMSFTVQLIPTEPNAYNCTIDTGTECASVSVTALVQSPDAVCDIYPTSLNFGPVEIGIHQVRSFDITNTGAGTLVGTVSEACPDFYIVSGEGPFSLATNETHTVQVWFVPSQIGPQSCQIQVTGGCTNVAASGYGVTSPGNQSQAVIALHATSHASKGGCANAPAISCSQYTVQWPLDSPCDLWLVVARGGDPGVAALSCGILYEDGQLGGSTLANGVGVDVPSWTLCTSGLEFTNGYSGDIADEWPASGGGNRITWDASVDCQTTAYGMDGIHAVAGYFYVYAYSEDLFQITRNNNLQSGPELQVGDCTNAIYDLYFPSAAAVCGFGSGYTGYNPCGGAVPVRLFSFTAERVNAGAEVRWVVAGADEDHLGFDVYRGLSDDDRIEVSAGLLTGRESYVFVDDDPPATAVNYWLAERSRAGATTWHGPVELTAASMPEPGLRLRPASPNPFLNATRIAFRTGVDGAVSIRVYDTSGREVARPFTGRLPAGEHEIAWDGRDSAGRRLSAGVYLYRVQTDQGGGAGKVVLIQ